MQREIRVQIRLIVSQAAYLAKNLYGNRIDLLRQFDYWCAKISHSQNPI